MQMEIHSTGNSDVKYMHKLSLQKKQGSWALYTLVPFS